MLLNRFLSFFLFDLMLLSKSTMLLSREEDQSIRKMFLFLISMLLQLVASTDIELRIKLTFIDQLVTNSCENSISIHQQFEMIFLQQVSSFGGKNLKTNERLEYIINLVTANSLNTQN